MESQTILTSEEYQTIENNLNNAITSYYKISALDLYHKIKPKLKNKNVNKAINDILGICCNTDTYSLNFQLCRFFVEMIFYKQEWDYFLYKITSYPQLTK